MLDGAEEVICPKRGVRVVWKVVAIILCVMLGAAAIRFASMLLGRTETVAAPTVDAVVITGAWFTKKFEEIQAIDGQLRAAQETMDAEILGAQQALERKQLEAKDRWISREGDRNEFDRLNQQILNLQARRAATIRDLQARRAALVVEYNACSRANPNLDIAPISTSS